MRHVTHQHAGSTVDEPWRLNRGVTCTTPTCGGLRRVGAKVRNRCDQATLARPWALPLVGRVKERMLIDQQEVQNFWIRTHKRLETDVMLHK